MSIAGRSQLVPSSSSAQNPPPPPPPPLPPARAAGPGHANTLPILLLQLCTRLAHTQLGIVAQAPEKALPCFPSVSDAKAAFKRLRPILASWESSAPASASRRHIEAPSPSQAKPWHAHWACHGLGIAQAPGGLEVAVPLHGGHASLGPRWYEASVKQLKCTHGPWQQSAQNLIFCICCP